MKENSVQENPTPEKNEKETNLENIVSQEANIADSRTSIRIASYIILLGTVGYVITGVSGLNSPFMFPILMVLLAGNQIYALLTTKKQKKLNEIKKAYESEFGVIVSPK